MVRKEVLIPTETSEQEPSLSGSIFQTAALIPQIQNRLRLLGGEFQPSDTLLQKITEVRNDLLRRQRQILWQNPTSQEPTDPQAPIQIPRTHTEPTQLERLVSFPALQLVGNHLPNHDPEIQTASKDDRRKQKNKNKRNPEPKTEIAIPDGFVSLNDAVGILGISQKRWEQIRGRYSFESIKIGRRVFLRKADIETIEAQRSKPKIKTIQPPKTTRIAKTTRVITLSNEASEKGPAEGLDLLGLHYADSRNYKFDRAKNRIYSRDIFKGQISLMQLEQMLNTASLSTDQSEQIRSILKKPRNAFLLGEIKLRINYDKTSALMRPFQERFLKRVARYNQVFERQVKETNQPDPSLTEIQNQKIIGSRLKIINRSEAAFDNLVSSNLRLVYSIAQRYKGRGLEFEDLIQSGHEGLSKAGARFDYSAGFQFSTYATNWIKQTISRAIENEGNAIRVPVNVAEKSRNVTKTRARLAQNLGRSATREELLEELGPGYDRAFDALKTRNVVSLNMTIDESGKTELGDLIPDESTDEFEELSSLGTTSEMNEALSVLDERERQILELRFGFTGRGAMTLEQVGRNLNLTRERVRQLEKRAFKKLRKPAVLNKLRAII